MKKKKNAMINTGLPSLLVIFVVLCLVTFAALSYVSAVRDHNTAEKTAVRTARYYETDLSAHRHLDNLNEALLSMYRRCQTPKETSFYDACQKELPDLIKDLSSQDEIPEYALSRTQDAPSYTFYETFQDSQALLVEVTICPPLAPDGDCYRIEKWQIISTAQWNPDNSLPVLQEAP